MSGDNTFLIGSILSIQTLCTCIISTIGQYIYSYFIDIYPKPSNGTISFTSFHSISLLNFLQQFNNETSQCSQSDIPQDSEAQTWAQQRSADLFFWINLYSSCPVIIMTYILGLYTPKLGKRFVLILPMIGTLGQFAIWLSIIYFHLPEYWWYVAAVIIGLSGSNGVLTFVLTLLITDTTHEDDLSSRFVRIGAVQTALSAIGTFAIGYYIDWRGFIDLYWIGFGLQIISILIVIFTFKTSDGTPSEQTPLLNRSDEEYSSNSCSNFFQVCTVFHSNRQTLKKSASLYLTLFSNIFYTLASSSFAPFLWFLLNAPFCWTSKDIGNYSAISSILYSILSVLGMQALTNVGASDAIICLISHIFFFASSLWLAFARHNWELYAGLFISAFSGYQGSLTMSMMCKWLQPDERSNAFTLVTEINTLITTFGTTFFNWIYARTVVNYKNFTFLLGAGLCIIPCILNLCLFLITRRMCEDEIPPLSETDIEPAPLRLPNNVPPHAGDAACIVIPSRSLTTSLRTPNIDRSRANSIDNNQTEEILNVSTNDLIIL